MPNTLDLYMDFNFLRVLPDPHPISIIEEFEDGERSFTAFKMNLFSLAPFLLKYLSPSEFKNILSDFAYSLLKYFLDVLSFDPCI